MALTRVITNIPTFFTNGAIDMNHINNHINNIINSGITQIVILGNASETSSLSLQERVQLAQNIYNNFRNYVDIIIGLEGNNLNDMITELNLLAPYANYIMISPPSQVVSQEGLYRHFMTLINYCLVPVILSCGATVDAYTIERLAQNNRVIAFNDMTDDMNHVMQVIELCPTLMVFSDNDMMILPIMSVGGYGVISTVSNIVPHGMLELVADYVNNHTNNIQHRMYRLLPIIRYCNDIVAVKYVLSRLLNNISIAIVRLPLVQLSEEIQIRYDNLILEDV